MKTPHSILVAAAILVGIVFFGEGRTGVGAQDSSSAMIARIEGQQSPNRQGHDGFTLQELMQKYRVPGISIAVIKDFEIHWAKGYGVADVETNYDPVNGIFNNLFATATPLFSQNDDHSGFPALKASRTQSMAASRAAATMLNTLVYFSGTLSPM